MSSALQLPWESLRAFAEGAFDGIAIIDEAGRIREWNSQACELFGWRRNEVLDRPIDELIAPQSDRDAFRESFTQIQREDRLSQTGTLFQVVGQHKSGSRLMVGISIVPICTEPRRLYAAYIRDVSQDSPLVPQLRPETTTIQLLYQTTMVSATALSYEEALGRSIERICELTGWTIGHAWLPDSSGEILKSSDIWRASDDTPMDVVREAVRDLRLQRGEGFPGQIWERRKPCWIADISTDPTFSQAAHLAKLNVWGAFGFPVFVHDQLVAVLEFFSPKGVAPSPHLLLLLNTLGKQLGDIFERRRWDEERRRLATIVESSQDAIISKTPEGIIASWNQGAEEVYGYRVEDAVGKPISLILPNDLAQEEPEIRDVVKNGRPLRQFETVRRRKNGRLIDVSITISPIRDANGNIGGTASIERDITRRTRHEHELMEAKQQAEIANRMKSEFLANISHELRTPMNAIIGMVDLSLASPDVPQIVCDNLATARESADVLLMLLNDLLDFSRLDVGRFEIECEPFPLRRTIDEAMHILALRRGKRPGPVVSPGTPGPRQPEGRRQTPETNRNEPGGQCDQVHRPGGSRCPRQTGLPP